MAAGFEVALQFPIIVNLTVEDSCHGAILARDRLVPSRQIYYRETAHAESYTVPHHRALIIRAAVRNYAAHPVEYYAGRSLPFICSFQYRRFDKSCDPTHLLKEPSSFHQAINDSY